MECDEGWSGWCSRDRSTNMGEFLRSVDLCHRYTSLQTKDSLLINSVLEESAERDRTNNCANRGEV